MGEKGLTHPLSWKVWWWWKAPGEPTGGRSELCSINTEHTEELTGSLLSSLEGWGGGVGCCTNSISRIILHLQEEVVCESGTPRLIFWMPSVSWLLADNAVAIALSGFPAHRITSCSSRSAALSPRINRKLSDSGTEHWWEQYIITHLHQSQVLASADDGHDENDSDCDDDDDDGDNNGEGDVEDCNCDEDRACLGGKNSYLKAPDFRYEVKVQRWCHFLPGTRHQLGCWGDLLHDEAVSHPRKAQGKKLADEVMVVATVVCH